MQFKELWEKVKKYDYKKLLCARNYVIAGCVALLVVAVILNATLGGSGGDEDVLGNESTKILGNSVLTDANADGDDAGTETTEDFFASAVVNRQRVRDEAMDVLRQVADSPDAMQETKNQALKSIEDMVAEMNNEINIETLIKAKGFEECVAVISEEKCSIIVKSEGLTAEQVAQILDIAISESKLAADDITIVEKAG
ncbi:MAG: SpoIIIAH-like family protein [Candidatus Woodwardiibium sp.]